MLRPQTPSIVSWEGSGGKVSTGIPMKVDKDDITQAHREMAYQKHLKNARDEAQSKWEDMSDRQREKVGSYEDFEAITLDTANQKWDEKYANAAAWVAMLAEKDCIIELVPVKYESYDKALYKELVSIGAANGQVDLDALISSI